jgi:DNA-binding transcriptional MerR regulator
VKVANVILPLRKQGFTFKKIADMLNEMKLSTAEGKQFHKSQVKRIVDRSLVEA